MASVVPPRTPSGEGRGQRPTPVLLFEEALKLQRTVRGVVDGELRSLHLRVQEYRALRELRQNPAVSGVELAQRLQGSPQAIQPLLARLERTGYIERSSGMTRAALEARLTPRGEEALQAADRVLRGFDARLGDRLGPTTTTALLQLLEAAHSALALLREGVPADDDDEPAEGLLDH